MFLDVKKYYDRARCRACREWMEPGFDNRISEGEETYHWKCYWQIVWPEKARKDQELKAGVK